MVLVAFLRMCREVGRKKLTARFAYVHNSLDIKVNGCVSAVQQRWSGLCPNRSRVLGTGNSNLSASVEIAGGEETRRSKKRREEGGILYYFYLYIHFSYSNVVPLGPMSLLFCIENGWLFPATPSVVPSVLSSTSVTPLFQQHLRRRLRRRQAKLPKPSTFADHYCNSQSH